MTTIPKRKLRPRRAIEHGTDDPVRDGLPEIGPIKFSILARLPGSDVYAGGRQYVLAQHDCGLSAMILTSPAPADHQADPQAPPEVG